MNPQDLLKNAANLLRQASQARQQEVNDLQQNLTQSLKEQEDQLNTLKQLEARHLGEAAQANDDATTTSRKQQARLMRQEESKVKDAHDQLKRDTDQLIKDKRRNIDDINRAVQSIDQWSQI